MSSVLSHHAFDIIAGVVLVCSILGSFLPPYEVFNFAPRFQGVYRILLVFVTQIGSINLRSWMMKFYPSFQGGTNVSPTQSSVLGVTRDNSASK